MKSGVSAHNSSTDVMCYVTSGKGLTMAGLPAARSEISGPNF